MSNKEKSLDEVRDAIAEKLGWKCSTLGRWWRSGGEPCGSDHNPQHPIPLTLDSAAECLPEGWYWWINFTGLAVPFMAVAVQRVPTQPQIEVRGPTEIDVRFRLALTCLSTKKEI